MTIWFCFTCSSDSWVWLSQVVTHLAESVKAMQGNLPVLQALRNPALRERHWTKLAAVMDTPLVTDPPLTLAQLLDLKVCNMPKHTVCLSEFGQPPSQSHRSSVSPDMSQQIGSVSASCWQLLIARVTHHGAFPQYAYDGYGTSRKKV